MRCALVLMLDGEVEHWGDAVATDQGAARGRVAVASQGGPSGRPLRARLVGRVKVLPAGAKDIHDMIARR